MAWREITEDDLKARVSSDELTKFKTTAVGSAADVLTAQLQQVGLFVRGYVFSCRSNYEQAAAQSGGVAGLGTAYAIPETLIPVAVDLLVPIFQGRVSGLGLDPDEMRKDARAAALKLLERVAACEHLVDEDWPLLTEAELTDLTGGKTNETPRVTTAAARSLNG